MSAFTLSNKHITAMLSMSGPRYPGDGASYYWNNEAHAFNGHAQEIGQKLVDQNWRSVNYRYDENEPAPRYAYEHPAMQVTPVQVIKACNCYNYQSCETPDWPETEAYAIMRALRERAINSLPGYKDAKWSID